MAELSAFPYGGSGDAQAADLALGDRFRRHADSLVRARRSPLYVELMRATARDIDAGGTIAELFTGMPVPPGSVPQLRLLAALHQLVLSGSASELARFYPSAGGELPADRMWPAALSAIRSNFAWMKERVGRTVQTNDPGRAAVLFAALLWLSDRYRRPIRLLEIGASAGLNLFADRYCYLVDGQTLGDPASPVRFDQPWTPSPDVDLPAAARGLRIVARAGCDISPLDPCNPDDRRTLLSYIWPDEPERFNRTRAALALAARAPASIAAKPALAWLPDALASARENELTVVWHSLFRQYVGPEEWKALQGVFRCAAQARGPIVWLSMEASCDHLARFELTLRTGPDENEILLAQCNDHGPPVQWERAGDGDHGRP